MAGVNRAPSHGNEFTICRVSKQSSPKATITLRHWRVPRVLIAGTGVPDVGGNQWPMGWVDHRIPGWKEGEVARRLRANRGYQARRNKPGQ